MNLYVSKEQARSMMVEHCLRCLKVRSLAFYQLTEQTPVMISVSEDRLTQAVKIQEFCDCEERKEASE